MKPNIHPQFYTNAKATCACGKTFVTGSTLKELRTEICSQCHPFYTGKQKLVDTAGTVDRFKKKRELAGKLQAQAKTKKPRKARAKK